MNFRNSPQHFLFYVFQTISHLKLMLHTIVGIFLGLTFLHSGSEASLAVANIGFLLGSIVYCCYTSLMPAVLKCKAII